MTSNGPWTRVSESSALRSYLNEAFLTLWPKFATLLELYQCIIPMILTLLTQPSHPELGHRKLVAEQFPSPTGCARISGRKPGRCRLSRSFPTTRVCRWYCLVRGISNFRINVYFCRNILKSNLIFKNILRLNFMTEVVAKLFHGPCQR
jgi:hypothetical protein